MRFSASAGSKVILRAERPHPGAQLRFTDADGMRITAIITDRLCGSMPMITVTGFLLG
jgi:hypothetical protein